jgi:aspartyl-tRNA(Asn)/glutamyl-tRNA(Gln) amidotransferase subunit C
VQLTVDDVRKVASLAKLRFDEVELQQFATQLGCIVSFVERLSEVDVAGVEPMSHPLEVHSVTRQDGLQAGLLREDALVNAPKSDGEYFLVPPVLGK